MRDPKRIKKILGLIEQLWNENPDWRFGQLLINFGVCQDNLGLWQVEDDEFEKHFKSIIKSNENKRGKKKK